MNWIVLHVGPEKCASSTIQDALLSNAPPFGDQLIGKALTPFDVVLLDCDRPGPETISWFEQLIDEARPRTRDRGPAKVLVLSHEALFKLDRAIPNLAEICVRHADEVAVVLYVRRQSDFLVSSFSQWLFRSPDRIAEVGQVLTANGLDPVLFWGVERHLIAAILGGWEIGRQPSGHLYLDWSQSVTARAEALAPLGVSVSVGCLPRPGFEFDLIADFLDRAGVDPASYSKGHRVSNAAYPAAIVEGVMNAIEAGHSMPDPHEANDFFGFRTNIIPDEADADGYFLSRLKSHIDTVFEDKNETFSREFNLPAGYFTPAERIDAETIRAETFAEAARRAAVPEQLRQRERAARSTLARMAWAAFRR